MLDMDGVLVDGEPLHFEAVNALLREEGRSISLEEYKPFMGTKSGWRELIGQLGLQHPYEHYRDRYAPLMVEQYRDRSTPLPGAVDLVLNLRASRMPMAVCSSSIAQWVEAALLSIGLTGAFDRIVSGDQVENGKPAPDIYLEASRQLGVNPARCLAIEDSPAGIQSARAAGMTTWAVRTPYTRGLTLPPNDGEVETLADIRLGDILGVAA
ncbi:MAG: HAD family phosphatase [Dehalococcoidia bacterium]|nr:HAD family phosphatase [Dehalococcoidia bacterium]